MAVIKDGSAANAGDIDVYHGSECVLLQQFDIDRSDRDTVAVTSRTDADDLIIALMVTRDTLWPIGAGN